PACAEPARSVLGFLERAFAWTHIVLILGFLAYIPHSKHLHILVSEFNVYFATTKARGRLEPLRIDLEALEEGETSLGAASLKDLTWKEILDTYSCTECGRCQTYCPTYDTGKPLTHKEVNRAIRHHAQQMAEMMPLPLAEIARSLNRIPPVTGGGHANGHGDG